MIGGLAASVVVIVLFFNARGNRDWVLIGIGGGQFMLTSLVVAVVLFFSPTDANIATLRRSAAHFLAADGTLGAALSRITLADGTPLHAVQGERADLFGHDYALDDGDGATVVRLWCGLNVNRFIVIYRLANPHVATVGQEAFVARLKQIFAFSLGGAASVGYAVNYEGVPGAGDLVSVWLTVATGEDLLTNPALKLFRAQDIAMMTESFLRTALRHADEVRLETRTLPLPL